MGTTLQSAKTPGNSLDTDSFSGQSEVVRSSSDVVLCANVSFCGVSCRVCSEPAADLEGTEGAINGGSVAHVGALPPQLCLDIGE